MKSSFRGKCILISSSILLCVLLVFSTTKTCVSLGAAQEKELDDMVREDRYVDAVDYLYKLLDEDDRDQEAWEYLASLTADPMTEETFDPVAGFDAYEELYYLKAIQGMSAQERNDLLEKIVYDWSYAITKLTKDIPTSPEKSLKSLSGNVVPVFLFFEAEWCGWCDKMRDSVESFGSEYYDRVFVIEYDVDYENGDLEKAYDVHGIPHNVFIDRKGNEAVLPGYMDRKILFAAYLAITDFFYEEKLLKDETLKRYIYRIYSKIQNLKEDELNDLIQEGQEGLWDILEE